MNIRHPVHRLHMFSHKICHIRRTNRIQWEPHGKQAVSIFSKCFPVKKVAPSSDHLPGNQSQTCRIENHRRGQFLYFRKDYYSNDCRDHTAVNGKSTLTDIKNIFQIIFIPQVSQIPTLLSDRAVNTEFQISFCGSQPTRNLL